MRFLSTIPAYQVHFRRMGFTEDDINGLTDHLVTSVSPAGDAAAIADRVRGQREAGADHVALAVTSADGVTAEAYRQVAAALGW